MENTSRNSGCQYILPDRGKFRIDDWAKIFDCSVETIRKNIKRYNVRTLRAGGCVIIVAEWWWEALSSSGGTDENDDEGGD